MGENVAPTRPQSQAAGWNKAGMRPVGGDGKVGGAAAAAAGPDVVPEADAQEGLDALDRQAKEYDKDVEIDRIMNAFRLDAYAVLDLRPGVPPSTVTAVYRRKSLLIHPDKTRNPLAQDAFDRLAKARAELLDDGRRAQLDAAIADARFILMRERRLGVDDEAVKDPDEEFVAAWREKTRLVLVEDEVRRRRQRRAQMQEEGREKRRVDEERESARLKREHDAEWEQSREKRIESWRGFQKDKVRKAEAKKKKSKLKPIG